MPTGVGGSGAGNQSAQNVGANQTANFATSNQVSDETTAAAITNQETLSNNGADMKLASTQAQEAKSQRDQVVVG